MLKLDEPFKIRNQEIFVLSFFNISDSGLESIKNFFLQFLVDILSLGSGSVDPHIFPDPDLDPKHCVIRLI